MIFNKKKVLSNLKTCYSGDFNLSNTAWPSGRTNCSNEKSFVGLFQDLNFDQLIVSPTHKEGKILDLLLCNQSNFIDDSVVKHRGTVCSFGRFSFYFKIKIKCKRLKSPKRKII